MPRKLEYHEQKLLKKVNFSFWAKEDNLRELQTIRRYHLQNREDYTKYNRMCGSVKQLAAKLKKLDTKDPFRTKMTEQLLEKLYNIGVIPTKKSLSLCEKVNVSAFCRRRLPIVMVRLKYAETVREAVTFVEQGHIRVGPETVTDPAFLVARNFEDFITWVDSSKIKRHVLKYNNQLDDYDLL
eukprot:TRINITY_DN4883_c0_g1_i1.p1 TRINITY_DN4883_c0_g1~~TRINITY_DN4883_c0_g1_i1.p1  ORF type:complete len:183 (-),score=42.83 TRINITY_DN4883_c0_g1_i1:28-576(-)